MVKKKRGEDLFGKLNNKYIISTQKKPPHCGMANNRIGVEERYLIAGDWSWGGGLVFVERKPVRGDDLVWIGWFPAGGIRCLPAGRVDLEPWIPRNPLP